MKKKTYIKKCCFLMFLVCLISFGNTCINAMKIPVYAAETVSVDETVDDILVADGGWIKGDPAGIYQGKSEGNSSDVEKNDPSWGEKIIIDMIKGFADFLLTIETAMGMNIDQIIFGRISPSGMSVNYFKFELVANNPFGAVGAYMYGIFRIICLIIIWCIFAAQLVKMLLISNSSKVREEFKESIIRMFSITLILYLMPYIWELVQYTMDILLYVVYGLQGDMSLDVLKNSGLKTDIDKFLSDHTVGNSMTGGVVLVFGAMASTAWYCALIYLGVMFLALYFVYTYLGIAMGLLIYFIMFPFICCFSYMDKNVLSSWVKNVFSSMFVPVIDAILLIIPAAVYSALVNRNIFACALVTFMICCLIIPSRSVIGMALGLNMGGINSIGSGLMNAFALAKGAKMVGKGIGGAIEHGKNAREANKRAETLEQIADIEEGKDSSSAMNNGEMPELNAGKDMDNPDTKFDMNDDAYGANNDSVRNGRDPFDDNEVENEEQQQFNEFDSSVEGDSYERNNELSDFDTDDSSSAFNGEGSGSFNTDDDYFSNDSNGQEDELTSETSGVNDEMGADSISHSNNLTSGTSDASRSSNVGNFRGRGVVGPNAASILKANGNDYDAASGYAKAMASQAGLKSAKHRANANVAKSTLNTANEQMQSLRNKYGIKNPQDGAQYDENGNLTGFEKMTSDVDTASYLNNYNMANTARDEIESENAIASGFDNDRMAYSNAASQISYQKQVDEADKQKRIQAIYDKNASINSVGSASFSNVSSRRQAELLRQYAKREKVRAVTSGVGAVAGGTLGMGAATFYNGSTKALAMGAGASAGENIGSAVGTGVYNVSQSRAGQMVGNVVDAAKTEAVHEMANDPRGYGQSVLAGVNTIKYTAGKTSQTYNNVMDAGVIKTANLGMSSKDIQVNMSEAGINPVNYSTQRTSTSTSTVDMNVSGSGTGSMGSTYTRTNNVNVRVHNNGVGAVVNNIKDDVVISTENMDTYGKKSVNNMTTRNVTTVGDTEISKEERQKALKTMVENSRQRNKEKRWSDINSAGVLYDENEVKDVINDKKDIFKKK